MRPPAVGGDAGASSTGRWEDQSSANLDFRPRLRISERKLLLLVADLSAVNLALLAALLAHQRADDVEHVLAQWFLSLSAVWLVVAPATDCYSLRVASKRRTGVLSAFRAGGAAIAVYLVTPFVTAPLLSSRAAVFVFAFVALFLLASGRVAYASLLSQPRFRTRVLVIGAGWAGRTIVQTITEHAAPAYDVVGYVDDDPSMLHATVEGHQVLGDSSSVAEIIGRYRVQEIILATSHSMPAQLHSTLVQFFEEGVRVTLMQALYEAVTSRIAVEHAGELWYSVLPGAEADGAFYPPLKRAFDVAVGLVGMGVLVVVLPVVALASKLDSPGPLFYRQERVGKGGRPFTVTKFRSMVDDAERDGRARWAIDGDSRVTRIGRILRASHLDELPQFLSVLRGDMSVVGPRPERPSFVADLQKQIPFFRARLLVKPGLTGWAQVMYPYGSSVEDAMAKLQYDLYYVKHQSLFLDCLILLKTIGIVLRGKGT